MGYTMKIMIGVSYIIMITLNALANILPINGLGTGEISDAYPNLFAPQESLLVYGGLSTFCWVSMCLHNLFIKGI